MYDLRQSKREKAFAAAVLVLELTTLHSKLESAVVGPNVKNPTKIRFKKFVKLTDYTYACNSLTYFEYRTHPLIMEVDVNLLGKTREITSSELILWRVLTIWNHCGPQPDR